MPATFLLIGAPLCLSLNVCIKSCSASSSWSTLAHGNQDSSRGVSVCADRKIQLQNLGYEPKARFSCSEKGQWDSWNINSRQERGSTKLGSILTVRHCTVQLFLTLLRTEALTGGERVHHNSSCALFSISKQVYSHVWTMSPRQRVES